LAGAPPRCGHSKLTFALTKSSTDIYDELAAPCQTSAVAHYEALDPMLAFVKRRFSSDFTAPLDFSFIEAPSETVSFFCMLTSVYHLPIDAMRTIIVSFGFKTPNQLFLGLQRPVALAS